MNGRLYYVDWLRVAAFAILILYHCSVAFFPDFKWLLKSAETSETLGLAMEFPRAWRLALLFFISGMGTWFAFRSSPGTTFLRDRAVRLGVPLIFAMCVVVVPQVWYERLYEDGYQGSFLAFWAQRYFTEGKYPDGNFTWAHMWFVAYLLVMALFCYPVMTALVHPSMRRFADWFERTARSPGVYLFFLLPLVLNLALTPFFPRATNALYNDGAWFASWASWFGLGFLFSRHHRAIIEAVVRRRHLSAGLAAIITLVLYDLSWTAGADSLVGTYENQTAVYKLLTFALAWTMILALVGYGALHLNHKSAALTWLNHKIFPLYIVHQTVIVAALYHVLPMHAGVVEKVLLVTAATIAGSLALAVAADRLPWPFRVLLGLTGQPEERAAAKARG